MGPTAWRERGRPPGPGALPGRQLARERPETQLGFNTALQPFLCFNFIFPFYLVGGGCQGAQSSSKKLLLEIKIRVIAECSARCTPGPPRGRYVRCPRGYAPPAGRCSPSSRARCTRQVQGLRGRWGPRLLRATAAEVGAARPQPCADP